MNTRFYFPRSVAIAALSAVVLWASSQPVKAGTIYTFVTPAGATNGNESVSAEASIDVGSDLIQVHLTDTSTAIHDMGQVITGLTISLSGSPTGASIASGLAGSSADVVIVTDTGQVDDYGTNPIFGKSITLTNPDPTHLPALQNPYAGWMMGVTPGTTLALSVFGTQGPNFGVLDASQASYPNTGAGSIAGNSPHNPFSFGTANFDVAYLSGVADSTKVTGLTFQFGTNQKSGFVTGTPVPEPSSLWLCSIALAGFAWRRLRPRSTL